MGVKYGAPYYTPKTKNGMKIKKKNSILNFVKTILHVHRNAPNNACRAELGRFPLLLPIQKRAVKFWVHLNQADPHCYQHKALKSNQLDPESDPLEQLAKKKQIFTQHTKTYKNHNHLQNLTRSTKNYTLINWREETKLNNKLEIYRTQDRDYSLSEYLTKIKNPKQRHTLTMYRLQ